jgi:hypothetical protein
METPARDVTNGKLPNPYDGFRAESFESILNDRFELYILLYGSGNRLAQYIIRTFPRTPEGAALCDQHFYLLQAVCRYMNCGGDPMQAYQLMQEVLSFTENRSLELLPPWSLLAVSQDVSEPTTVFLNTGTGNCVVVVENEYSEEMDIQELLEQIDVRVYTGPAEPTEHSPDDRSETEDNK